MLILLNYLQILWNRSLSFSTIKIYVTTASTPHVMVDGRSVGSHPLISHFLKGALLSRDLPVVLEGLHSPLFDLLEGADLRLLSAKAAFLLSV